MLLTLGPCNSLINYNIFELAPRVYGILEKNLSKSEGGSVRYFNWISAMVGAFFFGSVVSLAATVDRDQISEWYVAFESMDSMDRIADEFEVVSREAEGFIIYVQAYKENRFQELAPRAIKLVDDIRTEHVGEKLAAYRDIDEVNDYISQLAADYPEIVSLETYGNSASGRPLYVLKISDNVADDEDEPELLITSATHGDELITVEVNLGLIDELVKGYGVDPRLTAMVDDHELFFIPTVNPDGFARRSRYANGVDPNREYPWPEEPNRKSVECIAAEMEWVASRDIAGAMDFHASGELIMYPWAYTRSAPREAQVYTVLADDMAQANSYTPGQISRVIYVAKGSSADYWHWQHGTVAFGIELARSKVPSPSQIPGVIDDAREMTWRFIENF
jgi:hypothetical protein